MLKVALIGYGFLGKWHAEKAIANNHFDLIAIIDQNNNNLKKALLKYQNDCPDLEYHNDFTQVIDKVDAFIIATPTSSHYKICEILINNSKHIFCEKPMTETFEQALNLQQLVKETNYSKVFQVGHSERFHKIWKILEKKLDEFFIENTIVTFNRLAPFKNRAVDVDVVSDLMIHDIDLMLYLFKEEPLEVSAINGKYKTDNIDYSTAVFNFRKNKKIIINVSRIDKTELRSMEIRSPQGYLHVDLMNKVFTKNGETKKYESADHLQIENNNFSQSILGKTKVIVSFEDGLKAMELLEKVKNIGVM